MIVLMTATSSLHHLHSLDELTDVVHCVQHAQGRLCEGVHHGVVITSLVQALLGLHLQDCVVEAVNHFLAFLVIPSSHTVKKFRASLLSLGKKLGHTCFGFIQTFLFFYVINLAKTLQ